MLLRSLLSCRYQSCSRMGCCILFHYILSHLRLRQPLPDFYFPAIYAFWCRLCAAELFRLKQQNPTVCEKMPYVGLEPSQPLAAELLSLFKVWSGARLCSFEVFEPDP